MKFIARKQAPDIPLEVIEAQENDSLVFFCGSGVSAKAGLPTFRALVDNVYGNLAGTMDELETAAYKGYLYDRVLGLFETRLEGGNSTGNNILRQEIIKELELKPKADLSTHQAILALSTTKNGNIRLVTTNVDHAFLRADERVETQSDAAPKLPVAKAHKWESVVHLHGVIDEQHDVNGKHIVFTSGDFGAAYLTERWASRFVTDLFTNFTVLFVGYSVSDPVIRYITDAIAAENRVGSAEKYKKPFVIAHTKPKDRKKSFAQWEAMGIRPILYSNQGAPHHSNFHDTMVAWAAHVRDGLNAKERIIRTNAVIAPLPPYDFDEKIQQVVDTLKESANIQSETVTGKPAETFSNLSDPVAPFEWLSVLEKEGLLSIGVQKDDVQLVGRYASSVNLVMPNKITMAMWRWLLHHLEDIRFIDWIIEGGVCLHPQFISMLLHRLENSPPAEPYLGFWQIVTSGQLACSVNRADESVVSALEQGVFSQSVLMRFNTFLEPYFELERVIVYPWADSDGEFVGRRPYRAKVSIALQEYMMNDITQNEGYPKEYLSLLLQVTALLEQAMQMFEFAEEANDLTDPSLWDLPSISEHDQNKYHDSWVFLVKLCRDLWLAQYDAEPVFAKTVLDLWRNSKYPVFRRLVLNAITSTEIETDKEAIDYLLQNEGIWLWASVTRREVFRLLAKIWERLDSETSSKFLNFVALGPPRDMYALDMEDQDFLGNKERMQFRIYSKLKTYGRGIDAPFDKQFADIELKHPKWELAMDESDEFSHYVYTEGRGGYDQDASVTDIGSLSPGGRISLLMEKIEDSWSDLRQVYTEFCRENPVKLEGDWAYLIKSKNWNSQIWRTGIFGVSESKAIPWLTALALIQKIPDSLIAEIPWELSWLLSKAGEQLEVGSKEESLFWDVAERLLICTSDPTTKNISDDNVFSDAINDPAGITTEAILARLGKREIKPSAGIPQPQPAKLFKILLEAEGRSIELGRVILMSRLLYLYSIDPDWTRTYLLPLLSFEHSNSPAAYWHGFLRSPRFSADLATDLKDLLLGAFDNIDEFQKVPRNLVTLFMSIALNSPELLSKSEQQRALKTLNADLLSDAALLLYQAVIAVEDSRASYWQNRVKPLLEKVWPRGGEYQSSRISKNFSLMLIQLDQDFCDGLKVLGNVITPLDNIYQPLKDLLHSDLIERFPDESFTFFIKLFSDEGDQNADILQKTLDRFRGLGTGFQERPEYKIILQYVLRVRHG